MSLPLLPNRLQMRVLLWTTKWTPSIIFLYHLVGREPLHGGCKMLLWPRPSSAYLFGVDNLQTSPTVILAGPSAAIHMKSCSSGSWASLEWVQASVNNLRDWRIKNCKEVSFSLLQKGSSKDKEWGGPRITINSSSLEHSSKNQRGHPQLAKHWSQDGSWVYFAFSSRLWTWI